MLFRLTRYRLQAEWARFLLGLALVSLILVFGGWFNAPPGGKYAYFSSQQDLKNKGAASVPIDAERGADTWESFRILLRENRGTFYTAIVGGSEGHAWIAAALLGVLLLTSLFDRRLGPWLSAGVSRGRAFLSLTLVYYGAVILAWYISSRALMSLFQVSFAPEERHIRMTLQQAWLFSFLVRAALVYMACFLLEKPLPAALASLGGCILLRILKPYIPCVPIAIMRQNELGGPNAWFAAFCQDLSSVETGNRIALGVLVLSLAVGWLCFRKRTVR